MVIHSLLSPASPLPPPQALSSASASLPLAPSILPAPSVIPSAPHQAPPAPASPVALVSSSSQTSLASAIPSAPHQAPPASPVAPVSSSQTSLATVTSSPHSQESQPPSPTPTTSSAPTQPLPSIVTPFISFEGASHADRHPTSLVQNTRTLKKLTDAQKASRKIRQETNHQMQKLLSEELDVLLNKHRMELEDLAKRHGKKVDAIDKLVSLSSHYKPKRSVNIENAKIHAKSLEVNAGRSVGDRIRLPEIRTMVKNDPKYQSLTSLEEQELREEVMALREQKKVGARPSNHSAANDYHRHLTMFNDEITAFSHRTGAAVVAFFSRGHIEDTFEPNWICSPNAANFTQDTLNFSMWDITRLFEQWCCSKAKVRSPDSLATMRTECSATISGTLKTASRCLKAVMNYVNYDIQVVQKHQCKLVGWTFNRFVSPFDIHTIDDLRTLRDALRCGACHWVRMTRAEITNHAAELERRETAGETTGKKRKERSDKGVKKGPKAKPGVADDESNDDSRDNDQEAGPSKKKKKTGPVTKPKPTANASSKTKAASKKKGKGKAGSLKKQLPPTSKETLSDTDEYSFDSDVEGSTM